MDIVLQRACEDDTREIIELRNKSFYDDYIKFGECPGYDIPLHEMKQKILDAHIYKIVSDGRTIGDVSVHDLNEGYYWIGCLEIIPEYQNKGIGSRVIRYVEEKYPGAKRWGLDTPVQNLRNCCFYEKAGFHGVNERVLSEKLTLRTYEKDVKL